MERLLYLQEKLVKIQKARKLNASIKAKKIEQLQRIDLHLQMFYSPQIFGSQKAPSSNVKTKTMSRNNINEIINVFWGKNKNIIKHDNQNDEENDNDIDFDFSKVNTLMNIERDDLFLMANEDQQSEAPQQNPTEKWGRKFSYNEKRLLTINPQLKSTQKTAILCEKQSKYTNFTVSRSFIYPINLPLSYYDKVRIIVFYKIYGSKFDFDSEFPTVNLKRVLQLINQLQKIPVNPRIQAITNDLKQLLKE